MTGGTVIARTAFLGGVAAIAWLDARRPPTQHGRGRAALAMLAVAFVGWTAFLCIDHLWFPFHLETMEEVILQHTQRVIDGLPVYPAPTPEYVPLAYNPLFYYLAAPFAGLFGDSVATLRGVAVLGFVLSAVLIYLAVARATRSRWWGLIGLGIFTAAYRAMDSCLDNAHSDSWLLAMGLLGTHLIDRAAARRVPALIGVLSLVAAFWFKQHGALLVVGGLLYLIWRHGIRQSWPYCIVVIISGPLLYLAVPDKPFGSYFHYFTWTVPSGWSQPRLGMARRLASFFIGTYPALLVAGLASVIVAMRAARQRLTVWHVQLLAALGTAVLGALDPASSNNVFVPAGAFLIVSGTIAFATWLNTDRDSVARQAPTLLLGVTFALLLYDPRIELVAPAARRQYVELVTMARGLGRPVYDPDIGRSVVGGVSLFTPHASWVALADMSRGPRRSAADSARALGLLGPVLHPQGPAYVLTGEPLDSMSWPLSRLASAYVLVTDFHDHFAALKGLPKRFVITAPRYLYRYDPGHDSR